MTTPRPARYLRPGLARTAAEPLAWWTVLLAVYLALVSAVSPGEIAVGALAAAAGAAAAVAARRVLLTTAPGTGPRGRPVPPARLVRPLALLPAQIVSDTARLTVRGAPEGGWSPLAVAPGPANRGTATLLLSTSPGTYVGLVDPGRERLRVHRLDPRPSPFERGLRDAGLIGSADPRETGAAANGNGERP
ncbi:hypothetical protein [Actinomadura roseirufa]|uniref:hypothetical protein n=1 Tax=Actinomadura roseirufa TaxID=2094049 RepID=UPI001A9552C3|nr:hypothetical protein [Actinomadura roseirufa]